MVKDEVWRFWKSLLSWEVEVIEWKERLLEFENNLCEVLGDLSGIRFSLFKVGFLVVMFCGRFWLMFF